jgi:hypothetical protein
MLCPWLDKLEVADFPREKFFGLNLRQLEHSIDSGKEQGDQAKVKGSGRKMAIVSPFA